MEAQNALEDIYRVFAGDNQALAVLRGFAEGLTPAEAQAAHSLTATQYSSAQRRIRRTLSRYLFEAETFS